MENPKPPVRVVTAGEALIDLIAQPDGRLEPCLGGAVFNLTRALARQGLTVAYLNPLSGDRFGRQLAQSLADAGARTAHAAPVPQPTSLAVVAVDAHGHPDYAFYREGVADRALAPGDLDAAMQGLGAVEMVCTGCLALAPADAPLYLPWLQRQRAAGRVVVVDANLRPALMPDLPAYRANVRAALALADVVKASDEDLEALDVPGADALARARRLLADSGARALVLTRGAGGAALLPRGAAVLSARETRPVTVVDTVGAGDCFLAGLLAAWLEAGAARDGLERLGEPVFGRALLERAIDSATLCVMRRGADAPVRAELRAWRTGPSLAWD